MGRAVSQRRAPVHRAADPAESVMLFRVEAGRLPDRHAHVVRAIGIRIADALHDGEPSVFEQIGRRSQSRMQADSIVHHDQSVRAKSQLVAMLRVAFIGERYDCVDTVVTATELNHDQNAAVVVGLRRADRAAEECRKGWRHCDQRRTMQELSTVEISA